MRYYLAAFLALFFFIAPWLAAVFPGPTRVVLDSIKNAGEEFAAVILARKPVTVERLKTDYQESLKDEAKKVRILIVPGHEPNFGGTEYGSLKERELTVEVADNLKAYLSKDPHYEVFVTRNKQEWLPEFANYFKTNWDEIIAWQKNNRTEQKKLIQVGSYKPAPPAVYHNTVDPAIGIRLHGINKWANENNIDIVVHIHFNDYPHYGETEQNRYNGFTIYVPEPQFYNSAPAKAVANSVFKRLSKYNPVSNMKAESDGIVNEQDLIAIGSYNSLDAASMLIEYSYIYEPQLTNPEVRPIYLKEIAFETYLGILDFFDPAKATQEASVFDTVALPHTWQKPLTGNNDASQDVFALQTALMVNGDYPPNGSTQRDCPRTGKFGPCTKTALQSFQNKFQITDEKGTAGPKTIETLNKIFSTQKI